MMPQYSLSLQAKTIRHDGTTTNNDAPPRTPAVRVPEISLPGLSSAICDAPWVIHVAWVGEQDLV